MNLIKDSEIQVNRFKRLLQYLLNPSQQHNCAKFSHRIAKRKGKIKIKIKPQKNLFAAYKKHCVQARLLRPSLKKTKVRKSVQVPTTGERYNTGSEAASKQIEQPCENLVSESFKQQAKTSPSIESQPLIPVMWPDYYASKELIVSEAVELSLKTKEEFLPEISPLRADEDEPESQDSASHVSFQVSQLNEPSEWLLSKQQYYWL